MDNDQPKEGGLQAEWFCDEVAFPPGVKYITRAAEKAIADSGEQPLPFLCAHLAKIWGYVSEEDARKNDEAVKNGGRIHSVYRTKKNAVIWVITDADRSATTLQVPDEEGIT